jgi:hypothetical protein
MTLKFQGNVNNLIILDCNNDDDTLARYEIELLQNSMNIKRQVIFILDHFFPLWKFEAKKAHNMLCLMLIP